MDIRRLEEFIAVLDTGSLSKAAEKLGVAQPALSQSLARLERELGVTLFQRSRRGAEPTPAARQIAEEVRRGVFRIVNAIDAAQAIAAGRAGVLRVGLVSSALVDILPRALRVLRGEVPGLRIVLREMSNAEQAQALSRGEIDVALVHTPVALSGVMHEKVLMRERLVAAVPEDLLPGGQERMSMADIARAGLVMFPHSQLPTFYEAVMDAFRKAGLDAEIVQEANRTLTVLACVAGGCGIALLPSWIRSLDFAGVRYCEVEDGARLPSFDVSAIWPKRAVAGLADDFVRACGAA
ncbi:MAG: LysR family transcriptional regulator [Alcaligenaceae bacterium]|nr:LysR family transcriptional regulator [Alcaligenaceae bacterium SAGV5]MPS50312.1 LysR family transcriptional regulator [Alcaligenaceae bacterium SAGV3]MPT56473.1 LysR family transcriptional regulator [Alcaligenaceae bacterium]